VSPIVHPASTQGQLDSLSASRGDRIAGKLATGVEAGGDIALPAE
jgi:hypothetical protein